MKSPHGRAMVGLVSFWLLVAFGGSGLAAPVNPALLKAKEEAEKKGYIFETSHDDIVAKARKEGKLRVLFTMETAVITATAERFKKKYPFIDLYVEEMGSVEDNQRFLLEIKAGAAKGWDVNRAYTDFYDQYFPYQKKFDILGMATHKVVDIPPKLIDPRYRNLVTMGSNINVVAYNKKLIAAEKVPETWDDFLKPEFKGRKFVQDVRPVPLGALVPAWGLERTTQYAKGLAAQQPIWGRGHTRLLASVLSGEYALFMGPNLGAVQRIQAKDPTGSIGYKVLEPIPIRLHEANGVLASAEHPYAALLWLEFQASAEGQRLMDEYWPSGASVFSPGSIQEELTRGRRLSVIDWDHYTKLDDYLEKIVAAMGFPKAKAKGK